MTSQQATGVKRRLGAPCSKTTTELNNKKCVSRIDVLNRKKAETSLQQFQLKMRHPIRFVFVFEIRFHFFSRYFSITIFRRASRRCRRKNLSTHSHRKIRFCADKVQPDSFFDIFLTLCEKWWSKNSVKKSENEFRKRKRNESGGAF